MQFMATVDEVTDDGYVIVKADTQSERFPKIRKDVRYICPIKKRSRSLCTSGKPGECEQDASKRSKDR